MNEELEQSCGTEYFLFPLFWLVLFVWLFCSVTTKMFTASAVSLLIYLYFKSLLSLC